MYGILPKVVNIPIQYQLQLRNSTILSHVLFRNAQKFDAPLYGTGVSGSTDMFNRYTDSSRDSADCCKETCRGVAKAACSPDISRDRTGCYVEKTHIQRQQRLLQDRNAPRQHKAKNLFYFRLEAKQSQIEANRSEKLCKFCSFEEKH